jgi:DNA-binding transcriptional ArsR family regulator
MRKIQKCDPKVTRERAEAACDFVKSLANPSRLMLPCALIDGERSVGDLETSLGLRQWSQSQQLSELREGGIVEARREAKQVFYRIKDRRAVALLETLHSAATCRRLRSPLRRLGRLRLARGSRKPRRSPASSWSAKWHEGRPMLAFLFLRAAGTLIGLSSVLIINGQIAVTIAHDLLLTLLVAAEAAEGARR